MSDLTEIFFSGTGIGIFLKMIIIICQLNFRMGQDTALGVLSGLKGVLSQWWGKTPYFFENTNFVIILKSYLISRFKCHICRQPFFL